MTMTFWLWIIAIIVVGTLGSVAFKYGTNQIGEITLQKLMQFQLTKETSIYGLMLVAGVALFFIGGYRLGGQVFAARYLFTPIILGALVLLFISRFLIGIPLSTTGLGRLMSIMTSLTIVSTAAASAIVFKETYTPQVLLGIGLGIIAVILIGQG
jgi:drug/metabolite transporter (DMT)-like permease